MLNPLVSTFYSIFVVIFGYMTKTSPHKSTPLHKKPSFWILSTVITLLMLVFALASYNDYRLSEAERQIKLAEQARLSSDPIDVSYVYSALNTERSQSGAPALANLKNLEDSASQMCASMVTDKYFDYTNPATGKTANSYITDSQGELFYKSYVAAIFEGNPTSQTASDTINDAAKYQATNLLNPEYNSVGISVCDNKLESEVQLTSKYVVIMLANKQEKPVAPAVRYVPAPSYTAPRVSPTYCNTTFHSYGGYLDPTASTYCY